MPLVVANEGIRSGDWRPDNIPFNRDVQLDDTTRAKVQDRLVPLLTGMLHKRWRRESFPQYICGQPVLGKLVTICMSTEKWGLEPLRGIETKMGVERPTWASVDGQLSRELFGIWASYERGYHFLSESG